jgi:septum formation protein
MLDTNGLPLILGSSSVWRQEILKKAGIKFKAISPEIDEQAIRHKNPQNLVLAIAQAKAEALLAKVTDPAIIITCDQVILCNNEVREKPKDEREAVKFLLAYADFPAVSVTGVCVTNSQSRAQVCEVDVAKVFFNPMPMDLITQLIEDGGIMGSSGAFLHRDPLIAQYIYKIEGEDGSVSGMPLLLVERLIKNVL